MCGAFLWNHHQYVEKKSKQIKTNQVAILSTVRVIFKIYPDNFVIINL